MIILTAIFFTFIAKVTAQDALTLESSIEIALQNNLDVKVAKNDAQSSVNSATRGNAGLLPSLEGTANTLYSEHSTDEFYSYGTMDFAYTLFDGFGGIYNYKILNLQKERGLLTARYNIENTIVDVITGFYQLSEYFENVKVTKESFLISKERLQRTEAKFEFGGANSLDVLNSKVDFNQDSSSYLQAQQNYEESVREMNVLLGRSAETKIQLIPDVSDFQVFELTDLKKKALEENADYLIQANQLREDEISVKKAKNGQLPSVDLSSSYYYYDEDYSSTSYNRKLTGEVSVSYTIFDGKTKKLEIANAKIQKLNSELEYQNKMLELEKEIVNAYANYTYNLKMLSLQEDALEAAVLNFEQSKEYYQLGQITSTEFREAQQNLLDAQYTKSEARYDAKESEVNILQISGMLLK
jgi:outer membrane protein